MKYPALTRVFAIVLAIMAVIMIAVGGFGIRKSVTEKKESTRVYELLVSRTEELKELQALLDASDDCDELEEELTRLKETHEKNRSLHLINLGTYTATRSGLMQADTAILTQLNTMIPGLKINSYTLESFTGLAPLLVYIYPELQDAANNLQATVGTYTLSLREATAQLRSFVDSTAASVYLNEAELIRLAEECEIDVDDESFMLELINSAVSSGQNAAVKIDNAANSALNFAKKIVNLVDSFDGTVYSIDQYIPQLVQLLDSKAGLSDTKTDLVNSKTRLDKEQSEIETLQAKVDELQSYEKRVSSLSVLLKTNANIKAAVEKGGDLITVSESECESMVKRNRTYFRLSVLTYVLMIVAGLVVLLQVPCAYERIRSRFLLISPVIVFVVLSALAELIMELNKGERQYAAIVAAVLGVIQLAIILPKVPEPDTDEDD